MKLLSVAGLGVVFAMAAGCHGKEAPPPPAAAPGGGGHSGRPAGRAGLSGVDRHDAGERQRRDPAAGRRLPAAAGLCRGELRQAGGSDVRDRRPAGRRPAPAGAGGLAQAQAQWTKTQQDVNRFRPLAAQKAISQQELDNAVSAAAAAKAVVDAARGGRAPGPPQPRLEPCHRADRRHRRRLPGAGGQPGQPLDRPRHGLAVRPDPRRSIRSASRSIWGFRSGSGRTPRPPAGTTWR